MNRWKAVLANAPQGHGGPFAATQDASNASGSMPAILTVVFPDFKTPATKMIGLERRTGSSGRGGGFGASFAGRRAIVSVSIEGAWSIPGGVTLRMFRRTGSVVVGTGGVAIT
jgi:hypothetical protein